MSEQAALPDRRLTLREYDAWTSRFPDRRFELVDGQVHAMSPERVRHAETKALAWLALRTAIGAAGLPCHALIGGPAVEVGEDGAYQPDAMVVCGGRPDGNATRVKDPVIVVEVVSPSSATADSTAKFVGYFSLPALRHYLVVDAGKRRVVHHRRQGDGTILSAIHPAGPILLDPPGLAIRVEDLFEG